MSSQQLTPLVITVPPNPVLFHSGYELRWNWDGRGWIKHAS